MGQVSFDRESTYRVVNEKVSSIKLSSETRSETKIGSLSQSPQGQVGEVFEKIGKLSS